MRSARLTRSLLLSLLYFAFVSAPVLAQSVDTAGLEVDVRDSSGALMAGVSLTLTQVASHTTRTGITDQNGRYRFTAVQVGNYQLVAHKEGFAETTQKGLTLSIGQAAVLHVAMPLASAEASVTVNADVSAIDPDRTTIGQTISEEEIANLPSNGRNFLDFAVTVPGVTETQTTGQNSGFSVNGQRSRSNSIMIDGVENNGQLNGNVRQTLSQDAISQFQVLTEQFPADYGGAAGGFINVVTKGGTDKFHGGAYYFLRNDFLNSPNAFAAATPGNYSRNDIGGTFGGPIIQNRTFFFGALEYLGLNTSRVENVSLRALPASCDVNGVPYDENGVQLKNNAALITCHFRLPSNPFKGSTITTVGSNGYIPQSSAQTLSSLRIDHRINDRNTLVARVLYAQYIQASNINAGGAFDVSASASTFTHTQNYFLGLTHIFSPTLLDETHLMVAPQRLKQLPHTPGPGGNEGGSVLFGSTADFPVTLDEDHYEADNSLSWTHGTHLIKTGFQLNYIRAHSIFPSNFAGYWNYNTIAHLIADTPDKYTQGFGNPDTHLPDTLLGFYAEDSWRATSRLTLNYGIRYDLDLQPQGYNLDSNNPIEADLSKGMSRDYNNFAPRIGLALALDSKGKTVMRAGYGMFYDKNVLILARNALAAKETLILEQPAATALYATGPLPQSASFPTQYAQTPSISRTYPGLLIPFTHQADFGIDRAITSRMVLSATYVYVTGEKLLKETNINLLPPVILTTANQNQLGFDSPLPSACTATAPVHQPLFQQCGRPYFYGRKDPKFNDINMVGPWGHSKYSGLRAVLQQRAQHGLTFRFAWVWSKALDDAPDFLNGAFPDNPYAPHAESSLSNEDVRNRFTGTVVYRIPYHARRRRFDVMRAALGDWIITGIMTGGSGTPQNITVGSDMNNDDSISDRPFVNGVIVGRNSFRGGRKSNVLLRGMKEFRLPRGTRLNFSAEVFNVFNHNNITDYDTTTGVGGPFAGITAVADAASDSRLMQMGARFTF